MKKIVGITEGDDVYCAYAVLQAEGLEFKGIKTFQLSRDGNIFDCLAVFPTKDDAEEYLLKVIFTVKYEQSIGKRPANNLEKEILDFLIVPIGICLDENKIKERQWEIPT